MARILVGRGCRDGPVRPGCQMPLCCIELATVAVPREADRSVRLATWSTTTRLRAASSGAAAQSAAKPGVEVLFGRLQQHVGERGEHLALLR